jgi:hypothetical protein
VQLASKENLPNCTVYYQHKKLHFHLAGRPRVWQVFDKATAELRVEHKHLYSLYCCRRERHLKMEREVECGKEGLKLELK